MQNQTIEHAINRDFDGLHLKTGCAKSVLSQYGFERVMWVLANTLKEKNQDGRFSADNREWSRPFFIPKENHCRDYSVGSHSAVLDGFINQTREEWKTLGLFEKEHCQTEGKEEPKSQGEDVSGGMTMN